MISGLDVLCAMLPQCVALVIKIHCKSLANAPRWLNVLRLLEVFPVSKLGTG